MRHMLPCGVVPHRGTAHVRRCQATPWDATPCHVTCRVPHCAMCYTVPCHMPRRDVPRPVPCHVPRATSHHVPCATVLCHSPCCAMCHTMLCHVPRCATLRATPGQAPSHPMLPSHAVPCALARTTGTSWPPECSPSLPTDTRTPGRRDTTAQRPTGRGRHFISFCHYTKIRECHEPVVSAALLTVPKNIDIHK